MPNTFFNIDDQDESISRPINKAVALDVMREMGFPPSVYIEYRGQSEQAQNQDSNIGEEPNKNFFGTDTKATMTVSEAPVQARIYESGVLRRKYPPYFRDTDLNVFVRPCYTPYESTINFELRFKDDVEATRWHSDIIARSAQTRVALVSKAEYHFPIPKQILYILYQIHKTRESVVPSNEDFKDWFKKCRDPRVTVIANQSGKETLFVVAETVVDVQGWFDFTGVGEAPTYSKEKGCWLVSFAYTFQYSKPIGNAATYPLTVMNAMLPENIINMDADYDVSTENVQLSYTDYALDHFSRTYSPLSSMYQIPRIPHYDTWHPELVDTWTVTGFQMLIGVTPTDRRTLLNLKELGDYKLTDDTLAFLATEFPYVTKRRRSMIDISLYQNDMQCSDGTLTLDADMNLVATRDLDLKPVYHIRVAYLKDLNVLSNEDSERLRTNACQVYLILSYLFPQLVANGQLPAPSYRCRWSEGQWRDIVTVTKPPTGGMIPGGKGTGTINDPRTATVGSFGIIAERG